MGSVLSRAVLQWLGPNHRLTLWHVATGPLDATCLGAIEDNGEGVWTAWLNANSPSVKLDSPGNRHGAALALCTRVGVAIPDLPRLTDEEGE